MTSYRNELPLAQEEPLRSAAVWDSQAGEYASHGFYHGGVIIENKLDQDVSCQVQGKAQGGSLWTAEGAPIAVPKGTAKTYSLETHWGEIRVVVTPAVAPTGGTINIWLERAE